MASQLSLLAGQPAAAGEYPLNAGLRDQLTATITDLNRFWHTPLSRTIRGEVALVNSRTARMMGLIAVHRVRSPNVLHDRYLAPVSAKLSADIGSANGQLTNQTRAADQAAWTATLLVVGLAGALLVLSVLGLVATRIRRERVVSERARSENEQLVLRESDQRLNAPVQHGSDMITVIGPDTTALYQAGAVQAMLDMTRTSSRGPS